MAESPAPIEMIRQKLTSSNPDARRIALQHAAALGMAGRPLAVDVAWRLDDEDDTVSAQAVAAFRALGREAVEAVPVLLTLRDRGAPKTLVSRATSLLAEIGPAARDAVPALLPDVDDPEVLVTLLAIDPYDGDVVEATVRGALGADVDEGVRSWVTDEATEEIVDRLFAEIEARLPMEPKRAATVLSLVAKHRPAQAQPSIKRLLTNPNGPGAAIAAEIAAALDLADDATAARKLLVRVLEEESGSVAADSRVARVAEALARIGSPPEVGELLRKWLATNLASGETPWDTVGRVLVALAKLDPSAASRRSMLLALEGARRHCPDLPAFHAHVRAAFAAIPDNAALLRAAAQLGLTATPSPAPLPDFPEGDEESEIFTEPIEDEAGLDDAIGQGLAVLGLRTDDPMAIVGAVERWLQGAPDEADLEVVAVAFGEAVRAACGWEWCVYHEVEEMLAVVSPDRRYVLPPVEFLGTQLASDDRTITFAFDMLVSGRMPAAAPGSLTVIG